MTNSREAIRKELNTLLEQGFSILAPGEKEGKPKKQGKGTQKDFKFEYQDWYTKPLAVVRQLMPDRLKEFEELYKIEKRKEIDYTTYTISDYLLGLSITRNIFEEGVVNPETAFATAVCPSNAPVVGIVPEPTFIPFIVIDQFWAPVLLLTLQKSYEVIES